MIEIINNWRLSKKIIFAFGLIMALGLAGLFSTRQLKNDADLTVSRGLTGLSTLSLAADQIRELRILMYSHLNAVNDNDRRTLDARFVKSLSKEKRL